MKREGRMKEGRRGKGVNRREEGDWRKDTGGRRLKEEEKRRNEEGM